MKRAPILLGSTAAGLGLVLSFHTHNPKLTGLSTASGSTTATTGAPEPAAPTTTGPTAGSAGPATTAPATAPTQAPPTSAPTADRRATGQDIVYRYGDIQLQVTEHGSRISDITVVQEGATDPRSQEINSQAVPMLQEQAMNAQSARIDGVSGATFTSYAYVQALQSALDRLPR